jgi:cyclopropane fatty-acyl-phospholipid synthase-like methyltransferase
MTPAVRIRLKFLLRRIFGEPYVGKRMKMRQLDRLLADLPLPPNPRLLEVGSGDGVFCHWLLRTWPDATVCGIDQRAEESDACREWAAHAGLSPQLSFRQWDVLDLAEPETFDLILCLDVLEYVRDDHRAVRNMAAALKRGGWFVVHGPNVTYERFDGSRETVTPDRAHLIDPRHVRHGYSPAGLRSVLESAGLEVKELRTLHGRLTDLAFKVYHALEEPSALRLLSLPVVDVLSWIDRRVIERFDPGRHGNTVFAMARRI